MTHSSMNDSLQYFAKPDRTAEAGHAANTVRLRPPEPLNPPEKPNTVQKMVQVSQGVLLANPKELHGKNYVTKELEEHSKLTAAVISISSLINAGTNQPLLFFGFQDLGVILALAFSLSLNVLIVKFTNDNGTAVAGRKPGNYPWAKAGLAAMIAMSILQSLAAAVGSEALNNRPELSNLKAQELIERQAQKLAAIPVMNEAAFAACQEYEINLNEFRKMSRGDGSWDTMYVKLFGRFADRDRDWSTVPTENLPLEQRCLRLKQDAIAIKEQAQKNWSNKLAKRHELGDDVLFLEQEMPELFHRNFNDNYELRSGTETIRLAMLNLAEKAMRFDLAGLGFPLGFLVLSVISSAAACWMTFAHSRREDVAISRNDAIGEAIEAYLEDLIQAADSGSNSHKK